ncbi:hypothetical protein JW752_04210 [Candidatus Peregrinibacteria bacterium]|nr:hypothetical protein [Candidatus Peregrinibacteria bacterium]
MNELKRRGVIRTFNNPVADYAEWLVAQKLKLNLETNSQAGYDAKNSKNVRFQIKCRRLHPDNQSRQLGVIRNLDANEFDYLIGVIFNKDFSVKEVYQIPHKIINNYASHSPHQNGYILQLRGNILKDPLTKDISSKFV